MGKEMSISSSQGRAAEWHSSIGKDGQRLNGQPDNVDLALSQFNEHLVGERYKTDADKFNEIFQKDVNEYNQKQKRNDRKMGPESSRPERQKSYYDGIIDGTFCFGAGRSKENPVEEIVLQIGNHETNGVTDNDFVIDTWRSLIREGKYTEASEYAVSHLNKSEDAERTKRILKKTVDRICNLDPEHIRVIRADFHGDEPCGTPHVHLAVVFRATDYRVGMSSRVGMVKALEQAGFRKEPGKEYGIVQLHERFKDIIEEEMEADALEYGYDAYKRAPDTGEKRKRSDVDVYREMARDKEKLDAAKSEFEIESAALNRRKKIVEDKEKEISKKEKEIKKIKTEFKEQERILREREENIEQYWCEQLKEWQEWMENYLYELNPNAECGNDFDSLKNTIIETLENKNEEIVKSLKLNLQVNEIVEKRKKELQSFENSLKTRERNLIKNESEFEKKVDEAAKRKLLEREKNENIKTINRDRSDVQINLK